ncbi:MAG TPA: hypothetical protein VGG19_15605 [Tepidisphaeraceae bacterium]|jgi:hypothetical protein
MSVADRIGLGGVVVTLIGIIVPVVISQVNRRRDRRAGIKARVFPHVVAVRDGKHFLHGMAIELTSVREAPAEIVDVRIRLQGVDVATSFLKGYSGMKTPLPPPEIKPSDTGIEIDLKLERDGKLLSNTNKLDGIKLSKNHSLRFFTPVPFQPFDLQQLFNNADDGQVSIVAHILPEKTKTLLHGNEVMTCIRACLKNYRGKVYDPAYPWSIKVFTVSAELPDTWAMGKYNDKQIELKDRAAKATSRNRPSRDIPVPDFSLVDWRCEALRDLNLNLQELIAVPRGKGNHFHPQELLMPGAEAAGLMQTFADTIQSGNGFLMTLETFDPRPITIRFTRHGTAASALFSLDVDDKPAHMHGLVALLPRVKPADDTLAVESVKQFACLKDVPEPAFTMAIWGTTPTMAMFYADIGSANFPPLFLILKILTAAFFSSAGEKKDLH